jgi:hypothetical protein
MKLPVNGSHESCKSGTPYFTEFTVKYKAFVHIVFDIILRLEELILEVSHSVDVYARYNVAPLVFERKSTINYLNVLLVSSY